MKCQKCEKKAVWHIADMVGGEAVEIHLCEEHAHEYLMGTQDLMPAGSANMASALATHLAQQMAFSKASNEFAQTDQEMCPNCGMTFFEFRAGSKLGCPMDYSYFSKQITPLLMNIHGEKIHTGKTPKHFTEQDSKDLMELVSYRREMQRAVQKEKYEEASVLRDKIKKLEREAGIE